MVFDEYKFYCILKVPAAWLTLFNQLFLIAAIPVVSSFLYPKLDRAGIRVSVLFRIGMLHIKVYVFEIC